MNWGVEFQFCLLPNKLTEALRGLFNTLFCRFPIDQIVRADRQLRHC
jgi:hypothetical protein